MRKIILSVTLLLIINILIHTNIVSADFDYNALKKETGVFKTSEHPEEHYAFINALPSASVEERSFSHNLESDEYYSYFYNDLIVYDYDQQAYAEPVWRLWIEYAGTKHIYANSITFSFNGKDYTFSHILDQKWISLFDNGDASQSIGIVFGDSNSQFLTDMYEYILSYISEDLDLKKIDTIPSLKATLHGTEDISIELPSFYFIDFLLVYLSFDNNEYFENFASIPQNPTPMSISEWTLPLSSIPVEEITQTINIPEYGLVLRLPASVHWATLAEGDYEGLGAIYHKNPEQAKQFIETMGHCLMAYDPDSDLRFSISVMQMAIDVPNTKGQSEEEILADVEQYLGLIADDSWIVHENNLVFGCTLQSILGVNQLMCWSVIDGYMYQFIVRGSDIAQLKSFIYEITPSIQIIVPLGGIIHLELLNVDIEIPERWELASHEITDEEEYVHFYAHSENGTSTVASMSFTDIISTGPLAFSNRSKFDKIYTQATFDKYLPIASAHTSKVEHTTISGYDFAIMPHYELENTAWAFGIGYGYSVNLLYMSPPETISNDSRFYQLQELTALAFEKMRK